MKFFPKITIKTRVTLGLVMLGSTVAMVGFGLGLIPDYRIEKRRSRNAMCEVIASNGALMTRIDLRRWGKLLEFCVERNEELLSAGVRRRNGKLYVEVADHANNWPDPAMEASTADYIFVPIFNHDPVDGSANEWGRIEMRFRQAETPLPFFDLLGFYRIRFLAFFTICCGLLFRWYVGRILQHTDGDQSVPRRVREGYDFLAGGLVGIDKSGKIKLVNTSFTEMTGLGRETLLGQNIEDLAWEETPDTAPWRQAIDTQDATPGVTMKLSNASLGARSLMVSASPVIGTDGKFSGVLVSLEDVTPMVEARSELKKSKDEAEAANVAKSEFLANMSHEIRTPMNAILGFADLMRKGYDSSETDRRDYLNIIHSSGQHLLGLINDILDLSKVESGKMDIELLDAHPHQLANEVLTILAVRAREKELELGIEVAGTIPETISTDPTRLRQVLTNLVGNAVKFTESGSVKLRLRMVENSPLFAFDVIDTGIGIPKEKLGDIFAPFSQADTSTTRKYGGTGLGLSISVKLAEMMGGKLSATSIEGEGSTFTVTINPGDLSNVRMIDESQSQESMQMKDERTCEDNHYFTGRVLVVDDGESNRKLVDLVLSRMGVDVTTAENGEIAVDSIREQEFDFVLMDISMPVMDGYTALQIIRDEGHQVPIIALTAHTMKKDEDDALDAGFNGFLAKPLELEKLLAIANKYLQTAEPPMQPEPQRRSTDRSDALPSSATESFNAGQAIASSVHPAITCSLPLDDEEFLEIAIEFRDQVFARIDKMALLWASDEFQNLSREAHWLKGAGGTAGFHDFTEPAHQLEQAAGNEEQDACEQLIDSLKQMANAISLPALAGDSCQSQQPC